ncbi:MAG: CrcB family protein [Phycisphaerales bacterium]|nr:CrcB family protein [Phycisphaerales bacterium]
MAGMLMVMLGGGLGAILRYGSQEAGKRWTNLPGWTSIFAVNIIGSFAIAFSFGWLQALKLIDDQNMHLSVIQHYQDDLSTAMGMHLIVVGLCGGFTTFSTFSLDNILLLYTKPWQLTFNVVMSLLFATLAAWGGLSLGGTIS